MVVRNKKRNRKYLGTRRWGVGNIKNNRGAGSRGGTGKGGRKHMWTFITAKEPWRIGKKGFTVFNGFKGELDEITLRSIVKMSEEKKTDTIELKNYKVLSNGEITKKLTIKATKFSEKAVEKIKSAGGEALTFEEK